MSAPRTTRRAAALAARTALATTGLFGVFGVGGSAAADPLAVDFDPCANTLERAAQWPGTLTDDVSLVSDAFGSFLARRPVCQPGA